ncbi:CDC43 [Candida oxycetoniae]|uniref:CDC43 n=1 Tax=Candida oxycetoniae TaxID=497107 RepID=A0AAI9T0D8_9ASCO|nr:CDC43 [Candida oxycetoniae]KAI3405896.2 CDC43 [Candida oxycetoniae]
MSLLHEKHEKFFNRCLIALPAQAASEDSNKLAIIYFSLHGLQLLNKFNFTQQELKYHEKFIWDSFFIERNEYVTFRSTMYFQESGELFDSGDLSACLFALYSLMILKSDFKRLNWQKLFNFLVKCQIKQGSNKGGFLQTSNETDLESDFAQADIRQCYMALVIRQLLLDKTELKSDIDKNSLTDFILKRLNHNGGFGSQVFDEPHLGYTFCAIASLKLLGFPVDNLEQTKNWLVHRQVSYPEVLYPVMKDYAFHRNIDTGGFNGRENKLSDTCYSWWCSGSLYLLNQDNLKLINVELAEEFLLEKTQNTIMGGFSSVPDGTPDPMHTYLALASLSLWNCEKYKLDEIDALFTISKRLRHYRAERDSVVISY